MPQYELVRNFISEQCIEWIRTNENVSWPPRSPDLTPLDFFLWGTLKDVYMRLVEGLQNKKK